MDEYRIDLIIGRNISLRRMVAGMKLAELAGHVGCRYQQLHKYEAGHDRVTSGRLAIIAHALGVTPDTLYQGADLAELPILTESAESTLTATELEIITLLRTKANPGLTETVVALLRG